MMSLTSDEEDQPRVEVNPPQQLINSSASALAVSPAQPSRLLRQQHCKDLHPFLQPLLNLTIFDRFSNQSNFPLPRVPDLFQSHQDYLRIWEQLHFYETYCILMNSSNQLDKSDAYSLQKKRGYGQEKHLPINCYAVKGNNEGRYTNVRIYDAPPSLFKEQKGPSSIGTQLKQLKEFDFVILSMQPLSTSHSTPLKLTPDFMKRMMLQPFFMVGVVMEKLKRSQGFLEVKVDIAKAEFLQKAEEANKKLGYINMHCYFITSLNSTLREFRVLRMSEFYALSPAILQPRANLALKGSEHPHAELMREFIKRNVERFNPSQLKVAHKVTLMREGQLMLIQGPPGTGKTFTINAIISMLLASGVEKILVCAPSNAAIDEIITRIHTKGLIDTCSTLENLRSLVLRIGSMDYEPSTDVKPFTFDHKITECLLNARRNELSSKIAHCSTLLQALAKSQDLDMENQQHRKPLQVLVSPKLSKCKDFLKKNSPAFQRNRFEQDRKRFEAELKRYEGVEEDTNMHIPGDWPYYQNHLILKAKVLCTTLSMSGIERLEITTDSYDYLLIDEACQAVELSSLIPLGLNPKRVIMVGDEQQLPATTISENSEKTRYARSFFQRLLDNGYEKEVLRTQYRMHPQIRRFPSVQFYNDLINDADHLMHRPLPKFLQSLQNSKRRSVFFDLPYSQESTHFSSKNNRFEAEFTLQLVQFLYRKLAIVCNETSPLMELKGQIGIITPYKSQVKLIKSLIFDWIRQTIRNEINHSLVKVDFSECQEDEFIEVNTVDAYQGREKEMIIINTVRSNMSSTERGGLGFVVDHRRTNVAITRAKHFLFVVGHAQTLQRSQVWKAFIDEHRTYLYEGGYAQVQSSNREKIDQQMEEFFENKKCVFFKNAQEEKEYQDEEMKYYSREQQKIKERQEKLGGCAKRLFSQYSSLKIQSSEFGAEVDSNSESDSDVSLPTKKIKL